MSSIFEVSTYQAVAEQIVCDVFQTMLQYQIHSSEEDYNRDRKVVTAAVFFAGAWRGAVILECSEEQACIFCERLMGVPLPGHMDEDVRDAMGELVNMVGGNLKPMLLPGASLSMPSVLEGASYAYKICGSNLSERFSFRGEAGPLWVTLVQVAEPGN